MEPVTRATLVCTFLRGGMDGLMAVTPYTDPALPQLRPTLMLPPPGSRSERALLRLDDRFGLHPSFAPLLPFFQDGRLAVVHGVGSPEPTRSHFEQQEFMETGTPGVKGTRSGWLNRALALMPVRDRSPFRAIAMGPTLPRALYGDETALAISDLAPWASSSLVGPRTMCPVNWKIAIGMRLTRCCVSSVLRVSRRAPCSARSNDTQARQGRKPTIRSAIRSVSACAKWPS